MILNEFKVFLKEFLLPIGFENYKNKFYKNGKDFLCEIQIQKSVYGKSFSYAYDGNGMRYEKIVDGVKTNYYYNGNQLLMESKNSKRIWYVYGVTGIEGMIVEGGFEDITYYFDKNVLGDIIAIRDEFGNVVATYEYDAWGNCTVMNENGYVNTSASFIGNVNPFRYRGYYYDVETGFYYLQTRYYDPTICRFINADNYELVAELSYVPGQLNMYAYCGNNPITYTDETGGIAFTLLIAFAIDGVIKRVYVCTHCAESYEQDMGAQYEKVSNYVEYLFDEYSPYMVWVFLATAGVWSVAMGIAIGTLCCLSKLLGLHHYGV